MSLFVVGGRQRVVDSVKCVSDAAGRKEGGNIYVGETADIHE